MALDFFFSLDSYLFFLDECFNLEQVDASVLIVDQFETPHLRIWLYNLGTKSRECLQPLILCLVKAFQRINKRFSLFIRQVREIKIT